HVVVPGPHPCPLRVFPTNVRSACAFDNSNAPLEASCCQATARVIMTKRADETRSFMFGILARIEIDSIRYGLESLKERATIRLTARVGGSRKRSGRANTRERQRRDPCPGAHRLILRSAGTRSGGPKLLAVGGSASVRRGGRTANRKCRSH